MKKLFKSLSLIVALVLIAIPLQQCGKKHVVELTLMTYNVRNGVGMDNERDLARTAAVINEIAPDVVAIQELDSMTRRSGETFVLQQLADSTGMHFTYAPAIEFNGGAYGIGILSKEKPLSVKRVPLPGREEERTLLIVSFADYVFCCTHLSLIEKDRLASIEIIENQTRGFDKPVFIGGDFNSWPQSDVIAKFSKTFRVLTPMEPTYPADVPDEVIDYIALLNPAPDSVAVTRAFIVDAPLASDHRPVVVDVTIGE